MIIRFGKRSLVGDVLIAAILVALCLLPLAADIFIDKNTPEYANVYLDGELCATLPLDTDTSFSPDGGHTFVTIQNGRAYISRSDCPDGVCMEMDGVSKDKAHFSGNAVCVPNKVAVTAAYADKNSPPPQQNGSHSADTVAG